MLSKYEEDRSALEIVNIDDIVPKNHLLRKVDAAVDFNHLYDLVEDLYCADNGRPSIDPVVLFKTVLIQHLYGIRSLRQTAEEMKMNIAYRWFIGYPISKSVPHFATISYNFRHRFTEETVEKIFEWILIEVARAGYLSPEVVFVDGTHIKANANMKKKVKEAIPVAAKVYEKQLRKEVNEDREKHGKKPFDDDPPNQPPEEKEVTRSKTDPDSGVFHKGEHKRCFAYSAQTICDSHNFILGVTVNPGNMHDSVAFDDLYNKVTAKFPEIEVVTADAAYKTPWICKKIFDDERIPSMPYKRPMTKKGFFKKYEYVYEYYDCVICPANHILKYSTTNKGGYREFKSDPKICRNCPFRDRCTANKNCQKVVTLHIWSDYIDRAEDVRHSPCGKAAYELRGETIERVFADGKEKYGMRYTPYRGYKQLRTIGMLVVLDNIFNRITANRQKGRHTFIYIDEIYLLFQNEYSSNFLFELWKRVRKYGACATGVTQNVSDLLVSHTARTMLANSEFLLLMNQAPTDRVELANLINISEAQLSHITDNDKAGIGLLKYAGSIVPFEDEFPHDTKLYKLMTTTLGE